MLPRGWPSFLIEGQSEEDERERITTSQLRGHTFDVNRKFGIRCITLGRKLSGARVDYEMSELHQYRETCS